MIRKNNNFSKLNQELKKMKTNQKKNEIERRMKSNEKCNSFESSHKSRALIRQTEKEAFDDEFAKINTSKIA